MRESSKKDVHCYQCQNHFSRLFNLTRHLRRWHPSTLFSAGNLPTLRCFVCFRVFPSRLQITAHIRTHVPAPYQCPSCSSSFALVRYLNRHMRISHKPPRYTCVRCFAVYYERHNLCNHLEGIHRFRFGKQCSICFAKFVGREDLKAHKESEHGKVVQNQFRCFQCLRIFISFNGMANHRECVHRQNCQCFQCGKWIASSQMSAHIKSTHNCDTYRCFKCLRIFNMKQYMLRHAGKCTPTKTPRTRIDGSQQLHRCDVCGMDGLKAQSLMSHMEAFHSDDQSR